jgi:hypothetical protein
MHRALCAPDNSRARLAPATPFGAFSRANAPIFPDTTQIRARCLRRDFNIA